MDDHLWSLANVVTGFSIAQNLAFLYALGKDLKTLHSEPAQIKVPIVIVISVFTVFYVGAIWGLRSLASADASIWLRVTAGRTAAVTLFSALAVTGLFAPELAQRFSRPK